MTIQFQFEALPSMEQNSNTLETGQFEEATVNCGCLMNGEHLIATFNSDRNLWELIDTYNHRKFYKFHIRP